MSPAAPTALPRNSRSTVDAGIAHSSSAVLESVNDIPRCAKSLTLNAWRCLRFDLIPPLRRAGACRTGVYALAFPAQTPSASLISPTLSKCYAICAILVFHLRNLLFPLSVRFLVGRQPVGLGAFSLGERHCRVGRPSSLPDSAVSRFLYCSPVFSFACVGIPRSRSGVSIQTHYRTR
jgi:hypothetical protein